MDIIQKKETTNATEILDRMINYRRSVRIFDQNAFFDGEAVRRSIERAVLSPNAGNLQLWEFYRIKDEAKRKELATYCLGQNAATTARELVVMVVRRDLWKVRCEEIVRRQSELFRAATPDGKLTKKHHKLLEYWTKLVPLAQRSGFGVLDFFKKGLVFFRGLSKPTPRTVTRRDMDISAHKSLGIAAQTFMLSMVAEGYDTCPMEGFDSVRVRQFLNLPKEAEVSIVMGVGPRAENGVYGERSRVDFSEVYKEL